MLDLGCGTGGHAVPLAERGYDVVGVDRSPDMLQRAMQRGSSARFQLGEIGSLDLGETFDAVLLMFAVLGYQVGNADVQAALATARRHLHTTGLLFADLWYGPAVLAERPAIKGLTLPGMPEGSPGMSGKKAGAFKILAIGGDGKSSVYLTL